MNPPGRSLADAALKLGLHPFEVARLLGHGGTLRPDLRVSEADLDRLGEAAGIKQWWTGVEPLPTRDPDRTRLLVRLLARKLLSRGRVGTKTTRADNLLRGLRMADRNRLRPAVNSLIRAGLLQTRSSWRGVQISVAEGQESALRALGGGQALATVLQEGRGQR